MVKKEKYSKSIVSETEASKIIENKERKKGLLFIVSGPSGVGKGTLREKLFKILKNLTYSVSVTTRSPRKGEEEGIDYHFVTEAEFEKMIREEKFAEWAVVHGDYKGTPYDFLNNRLNMGNDTLLEIDVQGAAQVKEKMPDGIYIFIAPPSWKDLEFRLKNRKTEKNNELSKRLKDAKTEIKYINNYDYLIINDDIDTALMKLKSIVIAERCKVYKKTKMKGMIAK